MTARKYDTANKPYVDNYPPLKEWLRKVGASCMSQAEDGGPNGSMIEKWTTNNRVFLVVIHSNKHGWEIYTALDTVAIDATLKDVESRLGLIVK